MFEYSTHLLKDVSDRYPAMVQMSADALGDAYDIMKRVNAIKGRGTKVIFAHMGDEFVGYIVYGNTRNYFNWRYDMPLKASLGRAGIDTDNLTTSTMMVLKKEHWAGGNHGKMFKAWARSALLDGHTMGMFPNTLTPELAAWAGRQDGATKIEGFTDFRGHDIHLFDLKALGKPRSIKTKKE